MKNVQGFTMIELLIVIAIIGILAAMLIPNLLGSQKRAYDTGSLSCGKRVQTALAIVQVDTKTYPPTINKTTISGLAAACTPTTVAVAGTGTQNNYSFTVTDTRGVKTFTFTPSTLAKN